VKVEVKEEPREEWGVQGGAAMDFNIDLSAANCSSASVKTEVFEGDPLRSGEEEEGLTLRSPSPRSLYSPRSPCSPSGLWDPVSPALEIDMGEEVNEDMEEDVPEDMEEEEYVPEDMEEVAKYIEEEVSKEAKDEETKVIVNEEVEGLKLTGYKGLRIKRQSALICLKQMERKVVKKVERKVEGKVEDKVEGSVEAKVKVTVVGKELCSPRHRCPHCHRLWSSWGRLAAHMRHIHFDRSTARAPRRRRLPVEPLCAQCGDKFDSKTALYMHKLEHQRGPGFPCPVCAQHQTDYTSLKEHLRLVHGQAVEWLCPVCPGLKVFSASQSLLLHISTSHLDTRAAGNQPKSYRFKCKICALKFNGKPWLKKHMRSVHPTYSPAK